MASELTEHLNKEQFRESFAHAAVGLVIVDLAGRFLEVNDAYCSITGYTGQELLAGDFCSTTHPDDLEDNLRLVEQLKDGEIPAFVIEKRYVKKDGSIVWVQNSVSLNRDSAGKPTSFIALCQDISERKRAEEALQRSETELADFFENAAIGLHCVGPDGTVLRVNQAELAMLGYTREEYVGHHIAEFHADRDVIDDILRRLHAGEILRDYGARLQCKDGSIRDVLISSSVLWEDGKFTHTRCFTRDITERKRAKAAFRESEERFAKAFHASPAAMIISRLEDGRILEVNDSVMRLLGRRRDELVGRTTLEVGLWTSPDERAERMQLLREQGHVHEVETTFRGKTGEIRHALSSIELIQLGNEQCALGIIDDITERRRAEAALQESEERFRQLSEAAFEAIILHQEEKILEVNQSFCRMYGYEREEVIGKSVLDLALPQYREQFRQIVRSGVAGPYESPALRKDGTVFSAEVTGKPIHYQGRIARVGAIRDITEKKRNDQRKAAQYAVTRVLAESATLAEAMPQLLRVICESLRWKMGEFWSVCDRTDLLRCVDRWHVPTLDATSVVEASRETEFAPGVGLPGRVWQSGQPAWIHDLMTDPGFARAAIMSKVGLHGAVAFPILLGNHTLGVMLFCSRRIPEVDEDLLKLLSAIGSQIGQFIERQRAEEELRESEERYRDLVENIQDLVCTHDLEGKVLSANRALEKLLGYDLKNFGEKNFRKILAPEVQDQFDDYLTRIRRDGVASGLMLVQTSTGERRVWEYHNTLRTEGVATPIVRSLARDVTERRRAERALKESERKYRDIFTFAPVGIYQSLRDGTLVTANDALATILAYQSADELLEVNLGRDVYFDPHERERLITEYERRGRPFDSEVQWKRKDGSPIWVQLTAHAIEQVNGATQCFEGFVRDVTDRKRAEENAQRASERLEVLIHSVDGIVWEADAQSFQFTFVSAQAERILGFPCEQWINEPSFWRNHIHPEDREEAVRYCVEGTARKLPHEFEYRMIARDGRAVWLHDLVTVRVENDQPVTLSGVMLDITERKRAEEASRESEERYRELFENAKDAIYVHDLKGTYLSANRAAEKLTGYTRDEIIGKNFADFVPPAYLERIRENLCKKLGEYGETTYEVEALTKDGRRIPVEVSSRLVYDNGVAVGVQGSVRDITERKRAQEVMRIYSRRLIEAQEAERQRIARELHDQIGQVLTAVKLNLHTIQRVCNTPAAALHVEDSMAVLDEALDQVRNLSLDLHPSLLDDLGLVTALRWYAERQAQRTGVRAEVLAEFPDHNVRFSRELETACFRIAQEALTNVARHAQAKQVSVRLQRDETDLLLAIKDDGVGFDVDALRNRAPGAATLGLHGMEERALAVGGTIEINSTPSAGTEIRSRFPIRPGARAGCRTDSIANAADE